MGLVRNLKKRLDDWVNKILVELSYHYITQRAKQTTKKQDNSLQTGFSRSSLTMEPQNTTIATYSQDILEKITMKGTSTEDTVYSTRKWSIARIDEAKPVADKNAPPAAKPSKPSCQLYELIMDTIIKIVSIKLKLAGKL